MLINETWKIESDSLNITLYRKVTVKKTGGTRWQPEYYYSSPQNALAGLIKHEIMGTGLLDFKTVCAKIAELEGLVNTLKGLPEIVQPCTDKKKGVGRGKQRGESVDTPASVA